MAEAAAVSLPAPQAASPLAHQPALSTPGGELSLAEVPLQGVLVLRGHWATIAPAAEPVLGVPLPLMAGEMAIATTGLRCLWISPDEWWIVSPSAGSEDTLATALSQALAGTHHAVVVVSDYYTSIAVRGTEARTALAKLTPLDLHPRSFAVGQAVATVLAHGQATLQCLPMEDEAKGAGRFEVLVRASLADHVYALLAKAGQEWGMAQTTPRHVSLAPAPDHA